MIIFIYLIKQKKVAKMNNTSSSYAFWISIWMLIIVFFILAAACQSVVLVVLVLAIALAIGLGQCLFQNKSSKETIVVVQDKEEHTFADSPRNTGEKVALISKEIRDEYAPEMYYPQNTDCAAVRCATRNVHSGDQEDTYNKQGWVTGYEGPEPWVDGERALEKLAVDSMQSAESETEPHLLPEKCSTEPLPCPMRVAWQSSFTNCPSTFIEAEGCNLYKRDDRLWQRNLHDVMYDRSLLSGEQWDVFKHYNSRQKFAEFITEDLVNRKAFYEKPIENLEEASCFGHKLLSENTCSY